MTSSFDIQAFTCDLLKSETYQLAVILYPTELFNEKFLLAIRNCMIKLPEDHPVKRWLKHQAQPPKRIIADQKQADFLIEMLSSPFNLITDQKTKTAVIQLIGSIPGETNLEILLKSYLYLMIGNITRSDNYLKEIINQPPALFFRGYHLRPGIYSGLTEEHLEKVLSKFARHPADRLTFYLFCAYMKSFANQESLISLINEIEPDNQTSRLNLTYTQRIAPEFVKFLRLSNMGLKRRAKNLRSKSYPQNFQAIWVWPFLELGGFNPTNGGEELKKLEATDPLWVTFLLDEEKIADQYLKLGGQSPSAKRSLFKHHLAAEGDFMLALYKLIESGAIDAELVSQTANFMTHE